MNTIEIESSFNLDEIVESTKTNPKCHVALYYGKIVEDTIILGQHKADLITNIAAVNVFKNIREKWNNIENISIKQRVKDENIAICVSSNDKKTCMTAINYAVEVFSEAWKTCFEQQKSNDDLKTHSYTKNPKADCVEDEIVQIPSHMIQVQATTAQINKRIESFIERKREQVNTSNVKDFCIRRPENEMCARVDAVLCRRKDSKSHIQVRRVVNDCGPQMLTLPTNTENFQQRDEEQDILIKVKQETTGLSGKQLEHKEPTGSSTFLPERLKQEPGTAAGKFPPFRAAEILAKVEKKFKTKKRTFSAADIEGKLDVLKRRVVL